MKKDNYDNLKLEISDSDDSDMSLVSILAEYEAEQMLSRAAPENPEPLTRTAAAKKAKQPAKAAKTAKAGEFHPYSSPYESEAERKIPSTVDVPLPQWDHAPAREVSTPEDMSAQSDESAEVADPFEMIKPTRPVESKSPVDSFEATRPTRPVESKSSADSFEATRPMPPIESKSSADSFEATRPMPPLSKGPVSSADTQRVGDGKIWTESYVEKIREPNYATDRDYKTDDDDGEEGRGDDFKSSILSPLLGILGIFSARREERLKAEREHKENEPAAQMPELRPDKAAALYNQQAQALLRRCYLASFVLIILVYLSYGLPAAGALGNAPLIMTLMCLILGLVVTLIGLDIFTNGMIALFAKKPGAETLIAISCIVSALNAVYLAATGAFALGLPFTAVSAASMTFALWGSYLSCRGYAISFQTAAKEKDPTVVVAESGAGKEGRVLLKLKRPVTGFVRASESADIFENAYRLFTPLLLITPLVLTLFSVIASEHDVNLVHTLTAGITISASFSAIFGFALPFFVLAKSMGREGAAIAGYTGCVELGRIRRAVVTDNDVFPARTISIADLNIGEGVSPQKVISYTGSLIGAAGMGLAPAFTELMKKNGCIVQKVEDFACHEGGGLVARIAGDEVYVGSSSFMRLMGINIPREHSTSVVFTAINSTLAGLFIIEYNPITPVQKALVSLLRKKIEPLFAVRDFNITPMLIRQKFRLPEGSCNFPSFADRYSISSAGHEEDGTVVAVSPRGGLGAMALLISRGRMLYNGAWICVALSILGNFVGIILMIALSWIAAYDSASVGNALTFMLMWLVPVIVVSIRLR